MSYHNNIQKKHKHHSFGKNYQHQKSRTHYRPLMSDIKERKEEKRKPFESAFFATEDSSIHPMTEENIKSNFNDSPELVRKNRTPITKESNIPIPYFSTIITLCTCLAFVGLGILFYFNHNRKPVRRKIYLQQANYQPLSNYPVIVSEEKREIKQQSAIQENSSLLSPVAISKNSSIWSECQIETESLTDLSKRFFKFNVDFNCSICNMNSMQGTRHSSFLKNNEYLLKPLQCKTRLVKDPKKKDRIRSIDNEDRTNINCPVINILTYNGYAKQFK